MEEKVLHNHKNGMAVLMVCLAVILGGFTLMVICFGGSVRNGWLVLPGILCVIAVITFIISALAVRLGSFLGCRFGKFAERLGGTVLILMGIKILLEGLGVL